MKTQVWLERIEAFSLGRNGASKCVVTGLWPVRLNSISELRTVRRAVATAANCSFALGVACGNEVTNQIVAGNDAAKVVLSIHNSRQAEPLPA